MPRPPLRLCLTALLVVVVVVAASAVACVPDPMIEVPDFTVGPGTPISDMGPGMDGPQGDLGAAVWRAGKSGSAILRGVFVADPGLSTVYAVGHEGTILRGSGVTLTAEIGPTTEHLYAVLGISADEAYAVGNNGVILHRQNGRWAQEGKELMPPRALYGLSSPAQGEIFAVGDAGLIARRTGGAWTIERAPEPTDLRGVFGRAVDEMYAVGLSNGMNARIIRRGMAGWAPDPVPVNMGDVGNLYAVGAVDSTIYAAGEFGLVLRRDMDRWAAEPTVKPAPMMGQPPSFYGLYGSAGEVLVVGSGGAVQRKTGMTWAQEQSGTPADLWGVAGAGLRSVLAVGAGRVVTRRQ